MLGLIATQLVGTATLRPYVIGFLVLFLIAATRDLGTRRTVCYLGWALGVALAAELASTRVGFPFGLYHYTVDGQQLIAVGGAIAKRTAPQRHRPSRSLTSGSARRKRPTSRTAAACSRRISGSGASPGCR